MRYCGEIRAFIVEEILLDDSEEIGDEDNLLLTGVLDSLSLMRLVMHLEDRHGIEIPPEDVTLEHFGSLASMSGYLDGRIVPGRATAANEA